MIQKLALAATCSLLAFAATAQESTPDAFMRLNLTSPIYLGTSDPEGPGGIGGNNGPVNLLLQAPIPIPATVGEPFSIPMLVTGGMPPYDISVDGASPFSINDRSDVANAFVFDGTYTLPGSYSFSFTATDSTDPAAKSFTTPTYSVDVYNPLDIAYDASVYTFRAGSAGVITAPVVAGGRGAPTFSITQGALPGGVGIGADGGASIAPSMAGAGTVTIQATDADNRQDTATLSWSVMEPLGVTGVAGSYVGSVGTPFAISAPQATNVVSAPLWSVVGNLPTGLTVNEATGVISGTPSESGSATDIRLSVADELGSASSNPFSISISGEIVATVPTGFTTNITLPGSYFTLAEWSSSAAKRLVVPVGATVHSTSVGVAAITSSPAGGSFKIENRGNLYGAPGAGGTPGNAGQDGGPVFDLGSAATIDNFGNIKAGAGGGGSGGNGGPGGAEVTDLSDWTYSQVSFQSKHCYYYPNTYSIIINSTIWQSASPWTSPVVIGNTAYFCRTDIDRDPGVAKSHDVRWGTVVSPQTPGGTGGAGGMGESAVTAAGFGLPGTTAANGAAAGAAGGFGGGLGHDGSAGPTGPTGSTGNGTAGAAGGLKGRVSVNSNATIQNQGGTVLGR